MPLTGSKSVKQLARAALHLVRVPLTRVGLGSPVKKPYRPLFDERRLFERLALGYTTAEHTKPAAVSPELAYQGARRAREIIGPRFFVEPEKIAALSNQLKQRCPAAVENLMSRVRNDVDIGLPVYASRIGALGPAFDWSALPFGPGSDRMYAKRPHRFAFVPRHAWACIERPGSSVALHGMLTAWMQHAENGTDPLCYDSNLGVFQRLLALTWGWAFLAARSEEESPEGLGLEWLLLLVIDADARYLEPLLGDSVPNNHLLADRFAGWYMATILPELLDNSPSDTERLWCEELLTQTYPDGGSFEHSSHYHEFACEMGAAYLLLAKKNGLTPDPAARERTRTLLAYQCAMTGPEANPLPIGGAVEDTLFPLDAGESWCPGALREIYRNLFDSEIKAAPANDESVVRAFWLLGGQLAKAREHETENALASSYPQAGLFVLVDEQADSRLLFRTGPAPDTTVVAGHMHADVLAVYLVVQGRPLLVDAGTYSYRGRDNVWKEGGLNWRHYFAGPFAHNGFSIADEDPLGVFPGDFRKRETATRVTSNHASDGVLSYVDGRVYSRNQYEGLRRIVVHLLGEYWLLLDQVPALDRQDIKRWFGFQFAANAEVRAEKNTAVIQLPDLKVEVQLTHGSTLRSPKTLMASIDPLGGWVSPRYGERIAAPQLRYEVDSKFNEGAFLICIGDKAPAALVSHYLAKEDGASLAVIDTQGYRDWIIYQPDGAHTWSLGEECIKFDGRLLWLRFGGSGPVSARWLEGTQLDWDTQSIKIVARSKEPINLSFDRDTDVVDIERHFSVFQWLNSSIRSH